METHEIIKELQGMGLTTTAISTLLKEEGVSYHNSSVGRAAKRKFKDVGSKIDKALQEILKKQRRKPKPSSKQKPKTKEERHHGKTL